MNVNKESDPSRSPHFFLLPTNSVYEAYFQVRRGKFKKATQAYIKVR